MAGVGANRGARNRSRWHRSRPWTYAPPMRCVVLRQGPVGIASIVDSQDDGLVAGFMDSVQDPLSAAACGPDSIEVIPEGLAYSMRVVQ